jgi:hypothetical protein
MLHQEPATSANCPIINLSDLTLVVPFRCDSQDRLANLHTIIRYFRRYTTGAEVIILENGSEEAASLASADEVRYARKPDNGPFHRTRLLNEGVDQSRRRFVAT